MSATIKEYADAAKQITACVQAGDVESILNTLLDDQIRGLAADWNEESEFDIDEPTDDLVT